MVISQGHSDTSEATTSLPVHGLLLIVALAAAVVGQGAYYAAGQWLVTGVLVAALVAALRAQRWSRADLRLTVLAACAALAARTVLRAALAGNAVDAGPTVAVLGGLGIVLLAGRRLTRPEREATTAAMVAIGALAALTGWVGVAWHVRPWAITDQGLWRAATTSPMPTRPPGCWRRWLLWPWPSWPPGLARPWPP